MFRLLGLLPPSLLVLLALPASTQAFTFSGWPFAKKRFVDDGLIAAGHLGFSADFKGRIAAVGDWDGDQFLDAFALSDDQRTVTLWKWDHADFSFKPSRVSLTSPTKIHNIVPGDFDHDGRLDLLVMAEHEHDGWWTEASELEHRVYLQGEGGALNTQPLQLPMSTLAQPMIIDSTGELRPELLGVASTNNGKDRTFKLWRSDNGTYSLVDSPLDTSKVCSLSNPHSSAFIDLDGDCLADIFLHCTDQYTKMNSFQIWLNRKEKGFVLAKEGSLPKSAGAVSFADMDRDGTIDMVFPTCSSVSSSGIGSNCAINIAYNKQIPLCHSTPLQRDKLECRDPQNLCISDPSFDFDFSPSSHSFSSIPLSSIIPQVSSLLLFDTSHNPHLPLPLRIGDYNLDGFPDILAVVATSSSTTAKILKSLPCETGRPECDGGRGDSGRRRFDVVSKGATVLEQIHDVRGASWLDLDEDGSLDILLQRTGKQAGERVAMIQNNYFHDAFFLKTLVLNGACDGVCPPSNSSTSSYKPFGVSYPGASFKFTILSTSGRKTVSQVAQLPQTSYLNLQTPYTLFGLGRTNNYVENLYIGTTLHSDSHFTSIEGVIPNSQVVISPPANPAASWRWQLYLHPGEYVPWVTLSVVVATMVLAGIVGFLHVKERQEDELERRRDLGRLNFGAM